jgi:PAS domain S-box-containing protein
LSLDLLCIADFSGKFRRVNLAFTKALGYAESEFLDRPFFDFIHPDDLEKTRTVMEGFQAAGSPVRHFENRYRHLDGCWRTLSWQAIPIPESGIIFAAARDVTDIQLAQRGLRESEEYNRIIVESVDDCLKVLTLDGRVSTISENGRKLLEVDDPGQVLNTDWLASWNGADHENAVRAIEQARSGQSGRFQGYSPTWKGTPKWWDVIVSPIRGLSGEPIRLLVVSRDISKQKEIEEALLNLNSTLQERVEDRTHELLVNERRFRLMVDSIRDYAIFMLGPDGTVATWNSGAERIKGYTSEEIIGQHFSCFYTLEDISDGLPQRLLRKAATEGTSYHEGWRVRKDGSLFWAGADLTAIRDESGDLKGFAKVTRDLTERRNADDALREALALQTELTRKAQAGETAKTEFLQMMSHELRTPMHGILGYSDLLVSSPDLTADNRAYAETLSHCSRSLLRILDDILDFISAQNGILHIEKRSFSPRDLLQEIQTLLTPAASEKGLAFATVISPRLPDPLIADPGRLRQILLNLVGNAVKFSPSGTITLEAKRGEDSSKSTWEIIVRDTGMGIPD